MKKQFNNARFVKTAFFPKDFPLLKDLSGNPLQEIAFFGRSNVGKSSLINHLFQKKDLAKVSSTPGKTQAINFFVTDDLAIVDLPGYGFAQVPISVRKSWGPMLESYLKERKTLKLILFLFDIRREPNEEDLGLMSWISEHQKACILVLTKVDKVKLGEKKAQTEKILRAFNAKNLHTVHYSINENSGRVHLIKMIQEALLEEKRNLMRKLEHDIFVCLDCEFTGLDKENDRIIEVALALFNAHELFDSFETLIDPKCPIPEASIAIHHITPEMVTGKPTIEEVLPEILKLISDHILIGHGINHDVEVLVRSAKRASIPCTIDNNLTIDTLRMARHYGQSPINSLEQLGKHFNIAPEGAHRAMSDVLVNIEVFRKLAKSYKTTHELFEVLKKPVLMKIMPLGKHKGRPIKELPLDYLLWAARKDFDQDLLFSLRTEINRRKKGNLFSQESNPFNVL